MTARAPIWSSLPVDDLGLPVAGLTCLGAHESSLMSYELIGGGGMSGFRGFGVDEFAAFHKETAATQAAKRQAAAARTAVLGTKVAPVAKLNPAGAVLKPSPAQPAPALAPVLQPLPEVVPGVPAVGPSNACEQAGGYIDYATGVCVPPGGLPAKDDKMQTYLIAGGLVVALGTAAFFLTRKGK